VFAHSSVMDQRRTKRPTTKDAAIGHQGTLNLSPYRCDLHRVVNLSIYTIKERRNSKILLSEKSPTHLLFTLSDRRSQRQKKKKKRYLRANLPSAPKFPYVLRTYPRTLIPALLRHRQTPCFFSPYPRKLPCSHAHAATRTAVPVSRRTPSWSLIAPCERTPAAAAS
jgi:hypothetical protein